MDFFRKSANRFYQRLLRLYPEDFRAEYGSEMTALFEDRRRNEPAIPLIFETLIDALRTAPKEHFSMLIQDIRFTLRTMAKNPGFVAVALLSLAIGVGANTAMFSFSDALLLRPLSVPEPDRIVRVYTNSSTQPYGSVSYPDYLDIRSHSKTLAGIALSRKIPASLKVTADSQAKVKLGLNVNTEFFDTLQVQAALGRTFRKDDDDQPVVVLSHECWKANFLSDPAVIGRSVQVSNIAFTVIGVMPESYTGLNRIIHEDLYIPVGMLPRLAQEPSALEHRDRRNFDLHGRLTARHSAEEAHAEMATIGASLERENPVSNQNRSLLLMTERKALFATNGEGAMLVALLLMLSGLVLLTACANVANLLLSRARGRAREIAIRLAVGAGKARLLRQLITESVILALFGGAAGLLLASFAIRFLGSIRLPSDLPVGIPATLDLRALAVSLSVSLVSALLFGLIPAFQSLRSDVATTLKAGDTVGTSRTRRFNLRNLLVIGQVAISMLLLILSGLLIKDFAATALHSPGFRTDHILLMNMSPTLAGYDEPRTRAFYKELLERVRSLPGVRSAVMAMHVPLGFTSTNIPVVVEGYQMRKDQDSVIIDFNPVTEGYFQTMRLPLVEGREFNTHDTESSVPVAIVNQAMADQYWPGRNALGGVILLNGKRLQVVGISRNAQLRELSGAPVKPFVHLPFNQFYGSQMTLHVETEGESAHLTAPVLAEIRRLDAALPVAEIRTIEDFFREGAMFFNRLVMQLIVTIGAMGLLLSIIGLYGVIAYSVSRRTKEIGIRMAIGADRATVLRSVLLEGLGLAGFGIAIGLLAAMGASGVLSTFLVHVGARDVSVFLAIPLLLIAASLGATYFPARRAAQVDPLIALRNE